MHVKMNLSHENSEDLNAVNVDASTEKLMLGIGTSSG
jgi:hypothetical protein